VKATQISPLLTEVEQTRPASEAIKDFLNWVEQEKGLVLCEPYKPKYGWYSPSIISIERLVLEFFRIDLSELEKERRQQLEACDAPSRQLAS
jgi:hypothetical protein